MNSTLSDVDRLQSDDINGIRAIYGSDRPAGTPDLVVGSVQTSPRTLTAGRTFTLSASVRNVGNGTSAADDAALLLLPVEQRGLGGGGHRQRRQPVAFREQ